MVNDLCDPTFGNTEGVLDGFNRERKYKIGVTQEGKPGNSCYRYPTLYTAFLVIL